jgi:hypothetical protein
MIKVKRMDTVFVVYKKFYEKEPCQQRRGLRQMISWCIKEYIKSYNRKPEVNVLP